MDTEEYYRHLNDIDAFLHNYMMAQRHIAKAKSAMLEIRKRLPEFDDDHKKFVRLSKLFNKFEHDRKHMPY